jgi:hypothetical protein
VTRQLRAVPAGAIRAIGDSLRPGQSRRPCRNEW